MPPLVLIALTARRARDQPCKSCKTTWNAQSGAPHPLPAPFHAQDTARIAPDTPTAVFVFLFTLTPPKLGSFQDFMAGMAHLEERAQAPAEMPTVKSEATLYLDLPFVLMDADVLEW